LLGGETRCNAVHVGRSVRTSAVVSGKSNFNGRHVGRLRSKSMPNKAGGVIIIANRKPRIIIITWGYNGAAMGVTRNIGIQSEGQMTLSLCITGPSSNFMPLMRSPLFAFAMKPLGLR
jgi:hypothetical protein